MYLIDTNGVLPKKIIYKSLKEIFTELHQYKLNNPTFFISYESRFKHFDNYSGPCNQCLKVPYDTCYCDDIEYVGIKMVKYISNETDNEKLNVINSYNCNNWRCKLNPLPENSKGFRISTMLNNLYNNSHVEKLRGNNYKSMRYLYFGCEKFPFLTKNGIRRHNKNNKFYGIYYPGTTEILHLLDFIYLPERKADFKEHHSMKINIPDNYRRINTI